MDEKTLESKLPERTRSYWLESTELPAFPALGESIRTQVAVVGAGIAGVTTACLLAKEGAEVTLIDSGKILAGTTGHTTAKVTAQHALIYDELIRHFGEEKAKQYFEANHAAMRTMRDIIVEQGIDCGWTTEDNYVYATTDKGAKQIEDELRAYDKLGIPGEIVKSMPIDVGAKTAIAMRGQARFHPLLYLKQLILTMLAQGVRIHEHTAAVDIEEADTAAPKLKLSNGHTIDCGQIVVASHFPFCDKIGSYFSRLHTVRSHVVAARTERPYPGGM